MMPYRLRFAAIVMPTILFTEMIALGADGPFLAAIAAMLEIAGAMVVLALLWPSGAFWRAFALPLALMAVALGWLASAAIPGPDIFGRTWATPDLLGSAVVRFVGGCAMLTASAAVAWRRRTMRATIDWWLLLCIVQLGIALALRQWDSDSVWGVDKGDLRDRFTGTFLNANAAGCLFAMMAVLALGHGLALWRNRFEPAPFLTVVATPIALFGGIGACAITGSRTALIACLLALGIMVLVHARDQRRSGRPSRIPTLFAVAIAIGAVAILAAVGESTTDRLSLLDDDMAVRIRIWSFYRDLVANTPLGFGPGGFDDATLHGLRTIAEAHVLWYVHSAHNVVLSLLMTGGWPYLGVMVALVATLLWPFRGRHARRQGALLASVVGALIVLLVCSSVDIALDMPAMASLGAMLIGLVWGRSASAINDQSLLSFNTASTRAAAGDPATSPLA